VIIVSDDIIVSVIMVCDFVLVDVIMVSDIVLVDVIMVEDIMVEDIMVEDIIVEDIMPADVNWFDDGRTKPPMPAAARALRVEMIMAMLRMLDFDLNECSVVKS